MRNSTYGKNKASIISMKKSRGGNLQHLVEYKKSVRQQQFLEEEALKENQTQNQNHLTIQDVVRDQDKEMAGFEDGRETNALFSDYILIDVSCSCLTLLGVLLTVIEYDLEFDERNKQYATYLCSIITITSIVLILLTYLRFSGYIQWMKARKVIGKNEGFLSTGLIWNLLFEMVLVLVGPLPWTVHDRVYFNCEPAGAINVFYHVNEILSLILMVRVLLIFRTFLMLSNWYRNRSQRVCKLYACESDLLFVIKSTMQSTPYTLVSFAFFVSVFYFGFLIRVCEAPLFRQLDQASNAQNFYSYYNALWNIIITMTTVGYGDYYPQTHLGRTVIFIVSIWGVFIVSYMVVTMTNTLNVNAQEKKAIAVLDRLFVREKMKNSASTVLTTVAKLSVLNHKIKEEPLTIKNREQQRSHLVVKLKNAVNEYKRINRQYRSICDDNISEEMSRQFEFMKKDFKELFAKQKVVLDANIQIMKHLRMDEAQIKRFEEQANSTQNDGQQQQQNQFNQNNNNINTNINIKRPNMQKSDDHFNSDGSDHEDLLGGAEEIMDQKNNKKNQIQVQQQDQKLKKE